MGYTFKFRNIRASLNEIVGVEKCCELRFY